jgi:hypothetical protein
MRSNIGRRDGVSSHDGTFEMREGFDREIDSLLRRHARGTAESRLWGEGAGNGPQGVHLDADELNAFAEGALPAAARMAAATHLADCARCRGAAVALAQVAGAEVKHQEVKEHAGAAAARAEPSRTPAWRALFASLFAPRVMRFAVPVLALSLVGVVSYIALRSDKGALEAAREGRRQNVSTQSAPATATAPAEPAANENTSGLVEANSNTSREAPALVEPAETARGGHGAADAPRPVVAGADAKDAQPTGEAAAPPPPPVTATVTEGPTEMRKAAPSKSGAPEEDEVARIETKEENQNRDKSARASEPAEDVSANDSMRQRNVAQQRGLNQVQMPDGGARNAKRGDDGNASSGYGVGGAAPAPRDSDRAATRAETANRSLAARRAREAEKKSDDDESVRDAAGHRFRRKGNAWVDVNYKESMPSTGVRRSTEAFRALVADVPEVGRVAAALSGEVTVVVGGRAYHIR